jgi:hypothetical protein
MGDIDLNRGEQVILRTPGVYVKSIPFEGILTNMRIILVDRAKKILPTKDIALESIQDIETGENAIRDQILTLTVLTATGATRQMVLTFSQREGGNRVRDRDDWVRIIQQGMSPAAEPRPAEVPPQRVQVKRAAEPAKYTAAAPAAAEPEIPESGDTVFCTRCGNRVEADSAFCNRCGTPIVAPTQASRPAAPPVAPPRQQVPPPMAEPVYEPPAVRVRAEPPRAAEQPAAPHQPSSRPIQPVQKPAKKGLLGGLFGSGGKKAAPKSPTPAPERKPRRSLMPGKKTLIAGVVILVVIAVIAVGALFVYPMLSSALSGSSSPSGSSSGSSGGSLFGGGDSSSSTTLKNTGVASITVVETPAPTVPVTGIWVLVDYIGSYSGTYGTALEPQTLQNSGSRLFEVTNASGTVTVTLSKQDSSSTHELAVKLYKDGKLLKSGATSDSYGKVSISADVGTSAVVTTATTSATGNSTAKNQTATTVKTTVKTTVTTKTTTKAV